MKSISSSFRLTILLLLFSIVSNGLIGQKVNLDTLNLDQLNLYKDKAIKLKNTGMIMTFSGGGLIVIGYLTSVIWLNSGSFEGWDAFQTLIPVTIGACIGLPSSLIGINFWVTGSHRMKKAELTLQKFNLPPENSMALGVGITFRF